jgi:hypothetical protein
MQNDTKVFTYLLITEVSRALCGMRHDSVSRG